MWACADRRTLPTEEPATPPFGTAAATDPAAPADSIRPPPGSLLMKMPAAGPSPAFGPDTFRLGSELASFARRTRVEIRLAGLINRYYSDTPVWDDVRRGNLAYRYGPGGIMDAATFQCVGWVYVYFTVGDYFACSANGVTSDLQEVWIDTVVVQGAGVVQRAHVPDPSATLRCGDPLFFVYPCFTYEGRQEATVRPVASQLIVAADSTTVGSGSTVTFTARRRDGQPVTVAGWAWVVDTAAAVVPAASACAGGTAECRSVLTYGPPDSLPQLGIMYARADIGGVDEWAGVAATVVAPADTVPPDSLPPDSLPPDSTCVGPDCPPGGGGGPPPTIVVTLTGDPAFPDTVVPSQLASSGGAPSRNGAPWPNSLEFSVSVDSAGIHLPNRTVTLTVEAVDSAGRSIDSVYGHYHRSTPGVTKPAGSLSSAAVSTGTTGVGSVGYGAGPVSGPVIILATSAGAQGARDTVAVAVPALVALVQRQSDTLIGQTTRHPVNHYGHSAIVVRLDTLADSFHVEYDSRLFYNDLSLRFGGRFDVDTNWACCHDEHRAGRDIDLRTDGVGGLDSGERDWVRKFWERLGGTVYDETKDPITGAPNTRNPHYHLRYRKEQ